MGELVTVGGVCFVAVEPEKGNAKHRRTRTRLRRAPAWQARTDTDLDGPARKLKLRGKMRRQPEESVNTGRGENGRGRNSSGRHPEITGFGIWNITGNTG